MSQVQFNDLRGLKKREFNVVDFGATGNGTTDDRAAIQAAIDAAEVAGGIVHFPDGSYSTSATLTVEASDVHLDGPGVIVGALAVTPVLQMGVDGTPTYRNSIAGLTVTRAAGSVPAGSIGIKWTEFNYGSQRDVIVSRHAIGEQITHATSSSLGFESRNFRAHDCSETYLNIDNVTDVAWFGGELGQNGGETVGPVTYGILFSGAAEQVRFYNLTAIPRHATVPASALGFEGLTSVNGGFDFIHCNFERWNAGVTTDATTIRLIDLHFTGGRYAMNASTDSFLDLNAATRLLQFSAVNAAIAGRMSMTDPYAARLIGNFLYSGGSTFDGTSTDDDSSLVYSGNFVYETTTFTGPWAGLSVTNNTWGAGNLVTTGLTTETSYTNVSLLGNMLASGLLSSEISGDGSGTREVYTTAAGSAFYPTLALGRIGNLMPLVLKGGGVSEDLAIGLAIKNADGKAVLGAYVQLDTSAVTAGAEVADLVFFTKPAGSAATEKFRIGSAGQLGALLSGVPAYANNAAALAGGLTAGMFYRTNGDPDPICIVH